MEKITYITSFGDLGYYADRQPDYEWSFTKDINKAKEYKTLNNALERLFFKDVYSEHRYGGTNRCLIKKTSNIIANGNSTTITSETNTLSFDECVSLYKEYQNKKFEKKVKKHTLELEKTSKIHEEERVKWEKILNERKQKQDEFFIPKCKEIQELLNSSEYLNKRKELLITTYDNSMFSSFFNPNFNDFDSKYYSLYKLYNTLKILFDNNQPFVLSDNNIYIKNSELDKVRNIFTYNDVFKKNYCHFDREDLFKY